MFICNHLLNIHKSRQFTGVKTALDLRYVFPLTQVDHFHKILQLEAISKPLCYHSFSLLQSQISNLHSQISNLHSQISNLQISNLKVSNFHFQISNLKFQIFNLKFPLFYLQSQIFTLTSQISNLKSFQTPSKQS
jgi:hypothetical protein